LNIAIFVLLVSSISGVAIAADTPSPSPIANPIIDTDRSRTPEGKLTIAVHVSLSPKWLNPQEIPAIMAYELLWKLHDNMIKADPQHLYSYALADFRKRYSDQYGQNHHGTNRSGRKIPQKCHSR
jgi:hypothetical protein